MDRTEENAFWSTAPPRRGYQSIDDWSLEGREKLLAENEPTIRWLLDEAFTTFIDDGSLALFGFQDVETAVQWCLERFAHGDLDPARLSPASRTFRLFTEVHFWLAQKVGTQGYRSRIRMLDLARANEVTRTGAEEAAARPSPRDLHEAPVSDPGDVLDQLGTLNAFQARLGDNLRQLSQRTCPDLVAWWLEGTHRLRHLWFGSGEPGAETAGVAEIAHALSKKQRSICRHDALFRYLCLWFHLLPESPATAGLAAVVATCFSPCENQPPYRLPERAVQDRLQAFSLHSSREVAKARRLGLRNLIAQCLTRGQRWLVVVPASSNVASAGSLSLEIRRELTLQERLECALMLASLTPTLLHAYQLTDELELSLQLHQLPPPVGMEDQ